MRSILKNSSIVFLVSLSSSPHDLKPYNQLSLWVLQVTFFVQNTLAIIFFSLNSDTPNIFL